MTRTIALLFLLFSCDAHAQQDVRRIVDLPRTSIEQLTPEASENTLLVPADFAASQVTKQSKTPSGTIEKVYYFYTSYRQSASFDQKALDTKRIAALGKLFPSVLKDRYIHWELIEQTGCANASEGDLYFHGFVLVYRTEPDAEYRAAEIARMEQFLNNPAGGFRAPDEDPIEHEISTSAGEPETTMEDSEATFTEGNFALFQYFREAIPGGGKMALNQDDLWVEFDFQVDETGELGPLQFKEKYPEYIEELVRDIFETMPAWTPAIEQGKPVASNVNLELRMSFSAIVRGMYNRDGKKPDFKQEEVNSLLTKTQQDQMNQEEEEFVERMENSAVNRGMNAIIPREKVAAVMDVTTSMSKHIAGFSWWLTNSADSLNVVHYTFFNDGNNMEDRRKKVGETGGIYHGKKLRDMTESLMDAMRNGSGGDLPENDLEALLEAQNRAPEADALLLIVDNFSDVRDMRLLDQITKKTHVIIAGDVTAVRECYLDIAKATGGAIVVNGERISLENVHAGGRVTIGLSQYTYDGNHFRIL